MFKLLTAHLLLILFSYGCVQAQEWQPVRTDAKHVYGVSDTLVSQVVWVDSTRGGVAVLNRRIVPCDTCPKYEEYAGFVSDASVFSIRQPHFIGESWSFEQDTFRVSGKRPFCMPLRVAVGTSWPVVDGVLATLKSVEIRDFWGESDSVRIIEMTNGQYFDWSRKHGVVRYRESTEQPTYRLIGLEKGAAHRGVTVPTFETLFDIQVGDRFEDHFHISEYYFYIDRREQKTVVSVSKSSDSVVVEVDLRWRNDTWVDEYDSVSNRWLGYRWMGYSNGEETGKTLVYRRRDYPWLGIYPSQAAHWKLSKNDNEYRESELIPEQKWIGYLKIFHSTKWNTTVIRPFFNEMWLAARLRWDASDSLRFSVENDVVCGGSLTEDFAMGQGRIRFDEPFFGPTDHCRRVAWSRDDVVYGEFSAETFITGRVKPQTLGSNVAIYPNPTSGRFILQLDSQKPEQLSLILSDLAGRSMWSKAVSAGVGRHEFAIELDSFGPGVYLLEVRGSDRMETLKLVLE